VPHNIAPKNLDNALTGTRICHRSYILPLLFINPAAHDGKWVQGQVLSPSVKRNHPSLISLAFPKLFKVAQADLKANHKPI
jgi:hypothetical protein